MWRRHQGLAHLPAARRAQRRGHRAHARAQGRLRRQTQEKTETEKVLPARVGQGAQWRPRARAPSRLQPPRGEGGPDRAGSPLEQKLLHPGQEQQDGRHPRGARLHLAPALRPSQRRRRGNFPVRHRVGARHVRGRGEADPERVLSARQRHGGQARQMRQVIRCARPGPERPTDHQHGHRHPLPPRGEGEG